VQHVQFESIPPFFDGNGRTGRILNMLFLILKGLVDKPTLYLSRYITRTKGQYYARLQAVRDHNDWEGWVLYMLDVVEDTAQHGTRLVHAIREQMQQTKQHLRTQHPHMYSQELLNHLFRHPYTKIDYLAQELNVSRQTVSKYLNALLDSNILGHYKAGRISYFINLGLYKLLLEA